MRVQLTDAQKRESQERQKRAFATLTDTYRRLGEAIGLPLICPERACARAGRCVGPPSAVAPPCWAHYREVMRFFVLPALKEQEASLAEGGEPPEGPSARPAGAATVLEAIYGPDLGRLRRPKGAPASDCHECDPEGFARYMAAGDWREPFRAGREGGRGG
jgi:hypothetical protein